VCIILACVIGFLVTRSQLVYTLSNAALPVPVDAAAR